MAQTISLMVPAPAQIRPKAFAISMNKEVLTSTNLASSTRSMALAWMLDVSEAGADCMFSFEGRIYRTARRARPDRPITGHNDPNEVRNALGADQDDPIERRRFVTLSAFH
jgi:hypothetical protein